MPDTPPAASVAPPSLIPNPQPHQPPPATTLPTVVIQTRADATLAKLIADVTARAVAETRRSPGTVVYFSFEEISRAAGIASAHIAGELRRLNQPRAEYNLILRYLLLPGTLSNYRDKYALLRALENAVTYRAEVRRVGGDISCCLDKPAIAVTGRLESDY